MMMMLTQCDDDVHQIEMKNTGYIFFAIFFAVYLIYSAYFYFLLLKYTAINFLLAFMYICFAVEYTRNHTSN